MFIIQEVCVSHTS